MCFMYLHHKDNRPFLSIEIGYLFFASQDFYKHNSKALESLNFGFSPQTLIFHATMHDSDILIYRLKNLPAVLSEHIYLPFKNKNNKRFTCLSKIPPFFFVSNQLLYDCRRDTDENQPHAGLSICS